MKKQKSPARGAFHKAGFTCRNTKGVRMICSYSFCILSGGDEHFYMFICDLSIFLTSTAFVDTKAKSRVGGVKALIAVY